MKHYGKLLDLFFLIVLAFLINLTHFSLLENVLSTCLALSLASLCLFENYPKFQAVNCIALVLAAILWPPMMSFISIAVYFIVQHIWRNWLAVALVPALIVLLQNLDPIRISLIITLAVLAAWLSKQSYSALVQNYELLLTKDKYRELQLNYQSDREQWEILRLSEAKTATLEERARIAREMHDSVGHVLTRAILQTAALNKLNKDESLTQSIYALEETLGSGMTQTRASLHQLRDHATDLLHELELLCQSYPESEFKVTLDYDITKTPPLAYQQAFIANTKEALTNVQKHSNASRVEVRLREYPAFYQLLIQDNGKVIGLGASDEQIFKEGMGLESMRLRCEALGGNFIVRQDKGFGIFMTLPKQQKDY